MIYGWNLDWALAVEPSGRDPRRMPRGGATLGTVIRWDDRQQRGLIEGPDLPANCWVEAAVVHSTSGEGLRAGQVVEVDWAEPSQPGGPRRIARVIPRDDLQIPGG